MTPHEDRHDGEVTPLGDGADKLVMSTMWGSSPRWRRSVDYYVTTRFGTPGDLARLWRLADGKAGVILLGSVTRRHRYRDLVFAGLLRLGTAPERRPRVLITDATWKPESASLARLTGLPPSWFGLPARAVVRLIDGPHVRYAVLSTEENETFARTWGVDADRVVFTPFPSTIEPTTPTTRGDYLFAGGNSLRDYALLQEALRGTDVPCRVASTWQPSDQQGPIEAGPVPHDDFVTLLAGCRASVVPLQRTVRSAGQQSYLNAMMLAKPVVVTEAPGVRDYIIDGETGVIVPPDPVAMREAILHVMDPANEAHYAEMGRRAREWVTRNATQSRYMDDILLDAIGLPRSD